MLNLEINPALWTGETIVAILLAAVPFIVVPAALAVIQYRMSQQKNKYTFYLMIGVFASAILLGVYSVLVGLLLLVVYQVANTRIRMQSDK